MLTRVSMQCMQSRDIVVRLSVNTGIVSKRIDNTVTLLWHSGKGTILVLSPTAVSKFQGNPSAGALNIWGVKILQISPFISETIRDRPI